MSNFDETQITRTIIRAFHERLLEHLISDVLIVGAGPSGLVAGLQLARGGFKVTIVEKRLTPGGGIWGGGMAMNVVALQEEALSILRDLNVRFAPAEGHVYAVDAVELASALCLRAVQAGALLVNLLTAEDLCLRKERVTGVVVNRTTVSGALPVDPIMLSARVVVDATGHEAVLAGMLRRRGLLAGTPVSAPIGEGPMDAAAGEDFVVQKLGEVYPGLWVCGMSVCATFGGPRMGPIFGGMLLSGKRLAEQVSESLRTES